MEHGCYDGEERELPDEKKVLAMYKKILFCGIWSLLVFQSYAQPVKPYGAVPTPYQMQWQQLEMYLFVHFGPNTFTDQEWGSGKENPDVFQPSDLDCMQWARTAKLAGMKGIIITAKHHDGFCLWPSQYSEHTVAQSSWENGHGDVLKALSAACKAYGLKFGVYLSPWDRNHPAYGSPAYNQVFAHMLEEIYQHYGPVFEQWFDGAKGSGPGVKDQQYDWSLYHSTVKRLQPNVVIFSDVGPGARWVGNEKGMAGATNWSTLNAKGFEPGSHAPSTTSLNQGDIHGDEWIPAECDVSIRPGWFYSPRTDSLVKTTSQLAEIYYGSVGRNANLILNVPPDRRGHFAPEDSLALMRFRQWRDESFANNLALRAKVSASNVRGRSAMFSASHLTDGDPGSYWATDDSVTTASLELDFGQPVTCNNVLLREYIRLGQRVSSFTVEVWKGGKFVQVADGTTIGHKRILRIATQKTSRVRVNITGALACPVLSEIQLYEALDPRDFR
jgi:alpha-L-fucosidase